MQLSLISVILSILLACNGAPASPAQSQSIKNMGSAKGRSVGAAYCKHAQLCEAFPMINIYHSVITNEPDGNFIVAADIASDGKLVRPSFYMAVSGQ